MTLSAGLRLKLLRQHLLAALGLGGNVPIRIEETAAGVFIGVDGRRIAAPSPLRWKLYRRGWAARLDQLEHEYGVGRHVHLTSDSIILDVGANAGEFAHVADRYGAGIVCVEPDPAAFASLRLNIAGLANAVADDAVVWREDGEVDFVIATARADSSVFAEGAPIRRRAVSVETLVRQHALTRIDLLKCDSEGAEPEVLDGIGGAWPLVRAVALDTGPERRGQRTHGACRAILERHGFTVVDEQVGTRAMTYGVRGSSAAATPAEDF